MHTTRRTILVAISAATVFVGGLVAINTGAAQADPGRGHGHGKDCPDYHNGEGHGKKKGDVNHEDCVTTTTAAPTTTEPPTTAPPTTTPSSTAPPTTSAPGDTVVVNQTVIEGQNTAPAGTPAGPPAVVHVDRVPMTG